MQRWILGARLRTLPAAVVPVMVGTAAAAGNGIIWWRAAAALLVALSLQTGTNFANDYADGVRGTDGPDRVGPARLVGAGLARPEEVKRAALLSFGVAALVGAVLSLIVAPWLLLVGATALAAGWFYTGGKNPYGYRGLGEVFVFVFFGLVATMGSTYVQGRQVTWLSFSSAVAVGMLACALLVINNLRDRPTDAQGGKITLAVRLGDRPTRLLYVVLIDGALMVASLGVFVRPWAPLVLGAGLVAAPAIRQVLGGATGSALIPVLALTGKVQMAAGALLTLGLALSA
ncbi:MAG: 1,4-dihydroxy-2-naphthoate polyprenyltransferase [Actinobacteria bacterium]|jgi:1,4-dihydroxy-2-naphthoate polyprenyltransferase|nr:1,4-dihydroxy-2-naphthoate polyprenyltransferase [Actinomycetota bacterium]MBT3746512.1 1,4-dihydroxy-2-naphthoate polyprenyltransferase [Actinomycetota bacterium]MBT3969941.1 1,4-dihydroxy-2-naphthoate polyprenyltransferase [Actinomycetota bacterium]MBT4008969.1 1,4-dihydroxy-2-naphthoate polyprenyltransferase [Actinomycetota bacterium]MBT4303911.1 1,4-dihydroxy-2-naphthoate polyprenyltransferase [Actinomycetota bacterium]